MLTIIHENFEEELEIGELFSSLEFSSKNNEEICFQNKFNIEVKSLNGFYRIEGFRITKNEKLFRLNLINEQFIECADDHIVLTNFGWQQVKNLTNHYKIFTKNGLVAVKSVESFDYDEKLYDLQVEIVHSFYTNDILSHNSHFLVQLGAVAMLHSKNVLHYTFELSEQNTGNRYDSYFCHIDSNEIYANKDRVISYYNENKSKLGKLMIKEFPANTATISMIRTHMERLSLSGFVPDLIIFDYADLMRSSRQYDSPRHELKLIYEELRALATEKNVICATASQSNKEGINSDIIDATNMNESIGKAFTCDIILSLSRKSLEKASGLGRLFVVKNRAGRDGLCFSVKLDSAQSRFEILGEVENDYDHRNENSNKKALLTRWKELQEGKDYKLESVTEL